jgi:hypothetical protein
MHPRRLGRLGLAGLGLISGALTGALVAGLAGAAPPHRAADTVRPFIEATHVPPRLTVPNEKVQLRYDVYCDSGIDVDVAEGCDAQGSVFVRSGNVGSFRELPLVLDPAAVVGRYVAGVPEEISSSPSGFSYYAIVRSAVTGASATVPAGGAAAPEQSLPLGRSVEINLGRHVFGATRAADRRVVDAAWGNGPGEVGLEQGANLGPLGGSSFDVTPGGAVAVLDEAHRRVLRWQPGGDEPTPVPLEVNGTLADLALGTDDSIDVLESTAPPGRAPVVREFGADGRAKGAVALADRSASQLRIGPSGPVALEQPSDVWMPIADNGKAIPLDAQRRRGRSGRPLPGGGDVVVFKTGNEIRIAVLAPNGVRRSWRIMTSTPVGEVQLAQPLGNRLVLVFRVYDDSRAEFVAIVAAPRGLERMSSLEASDWAEASPLSRFRLVGSALYRLGSTPSGLFVDRFDLEVK